MMRPEGMRSSCALVVLALAFAIVACHDSDRVESEISLVSLRLAPEVAISDGSALIRFDSAFAPLTVRARRGGFAALDPKSHQLVLLDTELREQERIGRSGSGPGELRGVVRLEPWERGLAVGESSNGRISLFTDAGRFRGRVQRHYVGGPFSISDRGIVITPVQTLPHLIDIGSVDDPTPRRVGRRPPVSDPADERHTGRDLIVRRADGQAVLVENRTGMILLLRDDGTVTEQLSFPSAVVDAWQSHRRRRVQLFEDRGAGRVFAAPLVKDASAWGSTVLLASSVPPFCLVLVDIEMRSLRPVRPTSSAMESVLCRAESVALTREHLVIASGDSLLRFPSPLLPGIR